MVPAVPRHRPARGARRRDVCRPAEGGEGQRRCRAACRRTLRCAQHPDARPAGSRPADRAPGWSDRRRPAGALDRGRARRAGGRQPPGRLDVAGAVTTKVSTRSVADTLARLTAVVRSKGLTVFALVDHSGAAEASGLTLRDTKLLIFGSPQAGTPVMDVAPLAALD